MDVRGMLRPGMRTYLIPLCAGLGLAASAFLPWVVVGDVTRSGVPGTSALWVVGLGAAAVVLATLSLITRKNSRHPLLLVGLMALGIMFLSWRLMPRLAGERALMVAQAAAIVGRAPSGSPPRALVGTGIYLGLASAAVIVGFGLTIVVKRASRPYVTAPDDEG